MTSPARVARSCLLLLVVLGLASPAGAQDPRGSISGLINDSSGGRLPGVTVTATNVATNVPSTTTTNDDGNYAIPYLAPGKYTVIVELPGFKKIVRENIEVRVSDRIDLDFKLEVGNADGLKFLEAGPVTTIDDRTFDASARELRTNDMLDVPMRPRGGFVMRIAKAAR